MAVTGHVFGLSVSHAYNKQIDWDTDDIRCILLTSLYTPAYDSHEYYSDITHEVAAGGGYSSGGAVLASPVRTYTAATHKLKLSFADAVWAASTIVAHYAIILDYATANPATSPLICCQDFGADFSSSAGTFTVSWSASGILEVTAGV